MFSEPVLYLFCGTIKQQSSVIGHHVVIILLTPYNFNVC